MKIKPLEWVEYKTGDILFGSFLYPLVYGKGSANFTIEKNDDLSNILYLNYNFRSFRSGHEFKEVIDSSKSIDKLKRRAHEYLENFVKGFIE